VLAEHTYDQRAASLHALLTRLIASRRSEHAA
jgi:hypothetical protein